MEEVWHNQDSPESLSAGKTEQLGEKGFKVRVYFTCTQGSAYSVRYANVIIRIVEHARTGVWACRPEDLFVEMRICRKQGWVSIQMFQIDTISNHKLSNRFDFDSLLDS